MEQENLKKRHSGNRALIGLLLIAGGILLFVNKMGIVFLPAWLFTWPVLVIGIGFLIGLQHNFRSIAWIILMAWGIYSLLDQQVPSLNLKNYTTPVALILIGLFFIIRRRHSKSKDWNTDRWKSFNKNDVYNNEADMESGEFIDSTSVFSGAKKVIITKNFKGGDITCFMGGAEIDLSQADIQGRALIDATTVFGGIKLIVPSNWDVRFENHAVFFGNVEDKRRIPGLNADPSKQLFIEGTAVFGGIEIRN